MAPGFNTVYGVTAVAQIAGCFANLPSPSVSVSIPCPLDGSICIQSTGLTLLKTVVMDDYGGFDWLDTNVQVNTSISTDGYNITCINMPNGIPFNDLTVLITGTGCNGATFTNTYSLTYNSSTNCFDLVGPRKPPSATNDTLMMYPDPFCQFVTVKSPDFTVGDQLLILDATGRLIKKILVADMNTSVNLKELEDGSYILSYRGINYSKNQNFIKTCQ